MSTAAAKNENVRTGNGMEWKRRNEREEAPRTTTTSRLAGCAVGVGSFRLLRPKSLPARSMFVFVLFF
jgi:hypothetical protein